MCGRFNITATPGLVDLLASLGVELHLAEPRFNVAPTETVLLLRDGELQPARWWLTPSWSDGPSQKYAMFNARCEGLPRSRAFRLPFQRQRGLLPMSSFIEWRTQDGARQPWRISNPEAALAVAALWDLWRDGSGETLLSCTLVTTQAAPAFQPWHARMPVLLSGDEITRWLDNTQTVDARDPLFDATLKFPLLLEPIDRRVGNARNKAGEDQAIVGEVITLAP
jgi:putative SOS response-associated peptidase YedK